MSLPTITIDVDGLPVEVDAEDWGADPEAVEAKIRETRAKATDLTGLHEPGDDYDELLAGFEDLP